MTTAHEDLIIFDPLDSPSENFQIQNGIQNGSPAGDLFFDSFSDSGCSSSEQGKAQVLLDFLGSQPNGGCYGGPSDSPSECSLSECSSELSVKETVHTPPANRFVKRSVKRTPNHAQETKIALEIREMREREAELKRLRERLQATSNNQPPLNGHSQVDNGSIRSDDTDSLNGRLSPACSTIATTPSKALSLNGNSRFCKVAGDRRDSASSSGSSSAGSVSATPTSRKFAPNSQFSRTVSMQRFLKTRGRAGSAFGDEPPLRACIPRSAFRRCVTAETKIMNELKEMKERENELKQQRLRLSQPNLVALQDEEDEEDQRGFTPFPRLERSTSIPNLSSSSEGSFFGEISSRGGGQRRRSILIDQWEQKIVGKA